VTTLSGETRELARQLINYMMDGDVGLMDFHTVVEATIILKSRDWPDEVLELVEDLAAHLTSEKKDFKVFSEEVQRIMDIRISSLKEVSRTLRTGDGS
jgi:hypothetical protein